MLYVTLCACQHYTLYRSLYESASVKTIVTIHDKHTPDKNNQQPHSTGLNQSHTHKRTHAKKGFTFCSQMISILPVFNSRTLAPLPHPTHLPRHISTLIASPLPITLVIPHATLTCPCAQPDVRKWSESKDRAKGPPCIDVI